MKVLMWTLILATPLLLQKARGQGVPAAPAKTPELSSEEAREIWDTGFLKKRPAPAHPGSHSQTPHYAVQTHKAAAKASEAKPSKAAIGLTVWRLRAPVAAEHDDSRLLLQDKGDKNGVVLIPERLDAADPLREGDRVRLSIEVPRAGFLYVIDREKYRDGLLGAPMLIYPTLDMNGGRNDVAPGRVIEIPPRDSEVVALKINRSGNRQTGEDLTFIVSPQALLEITLTDGMQALPPALVAGWEAKWGTSSLELNLVGGEHQVWTEAERQAGGSGRLSQADPLPQTILSVAAEDEARPLLVHLPLAIQ